jgi:hypothetical protein
MGGYDPRHGGVPQRARPRPPAPPGRRVSDEARREPGDAWPGDQGPAEDPLAHVTDEERAVLAKVADILRRIEFGTVVLVVQDGKVVQIEMAEKFRLR